MEQFHTYYHHNAYQDLPPFDASAYPLPDFVDAERVLPQNHVQRCWQQNRQEYQRVTEMRKEKSRDAARSRRRNENREYLELSKFLPLPGAITSQLDKASVVRLAITSLKLKKFAAEGLPQWQQLPHKTEPGRAQSPSSQLREHIDVNFGNHALQAHDGFVLALAHDGIILYISETVSVYLGLSQVELTGCSLFDYLHQDDRAELAAALGIKPESIYPPDDLEPSHEPPVAPLHVLLNGTYESSGAAEKMWAAASYSNDARQVKAEPGALCVRFRSTLTKRGVQMKYSGYRVLHLQWAPRFCSPIYGQMGRDAGDRFHTPLLLGFTMCATALPSLNMNELRLDCAQFVTKLTLDFKIISAEGQCANADDISVEDSFKEGTSLYQHCFGADVTLLRFLHASVIRKGQCLSQPYRMMSKTGGYFWVQTCAHLMVNGKVAEEQSVVAVHTVLSDVLAADFSFASRRLLPTVEVRIKREADEHNGDEWKTAATNLPDALPEPPKKERKRKAVEGKKTSRSKSARASR